MLMKICLAAVVLAAPPAAPAAPWEAVPQPELARQLEQAPPLPVEEVGIPARSVTAYSPTLVPNPDGKSYDVLQWYYRDYGGPTWLYAIDLGTGQVKKQRFPDRRQIHLAGQTLAPDGKYYLVTPDWAKGGGMELFVYDPATNTLSERGRIVPDLVGERRDLILGPDGKLYGTGNYRDSHKAGAYSYDPQTGRVRNYGPIGPSHAPYGAFGYFLGVDDTHLYVASGKIPWYLVAVDLASGAEKVLFETRSGESQITVSERFPGAVARVRESAEAAAQEYWLYHGQAIPKTSETPPWPARPSLLPPAPPRPELYTGQLPPDDAGHATLWFRLPVAGSRPAPNAQPPTPQELGWKPIALEGIETYPLATHRLTRLPDGRFFGTASGYLGNFLFDARTGAITALGDGGASPYTYLVHDGRLYWSGYPSGPVYVYDPAKPYTLGKSGPPGHAAPAETSPESNPRLLGNLFEQTRVKKMFSAAAGADGKIYFGGIGQRDYDGGGLGWYDPRTGMLGGMWRPFSGYAIHWLTPAMDGRFLVISTRVQEDELNANRVPEAAKLFVYDTRTERITREIVPVPKAVKSGPLLEVAPGRLLGMTEDPANPGGGLLYGVDLHTGEILFRKKLPVGLKFPWAQGTAQWDYRQGPDGFIWTYLGSVLVRIDPHDARVEVVGRLGAPGKLAFAGDDLYLTGATQLRRIPGAGKR